jgi:hypothetical protein
MNSGSEDYSSSDGLRRKTGVATLRLSSTSQGTLRLSQDGRKKKRDFDAVDDDFTLTGSLSRSLQLPKGASRARDFQERNSLSSTRSSHQVPRYSVSDGDDDVEPPDDPEADEKSDHRGSLQYTRDSLSVHGFDETIDSNPGNSVGRSSVSSRPRYGGGGDDSDDDDLRSAFHLTNDEYLADTNTHSAGTYTSDMSKDHDPIDFDQTIVTDISGPGDDIAERANAYERNARESVKQAPRTPQNLSIGSRPIMTASSRGTASPFDAMASDFDDDGSLELSQSNDMFGNMMEPSRSARLREEK